MTKVVFRLIGYARGSALHHSEMPVCVDNQRHNRLAVHIESFGAGGCVRLVSCNRLNSIAFNNYCLIWLRRSTGAIYHVVPPTRRASKPAGEWNAITIRAQGRNVVVVLNGKKIVDADLDRCLKDPAVAKEHTGLARTTGRLGLQSHSERVELTEASLVQRLETRIAQQLASEQAAGATTRHGWSGGALTGARALSR